MLLQGDGPQALGGGGGGVGGWGEVWDVGSQVIVVGPRRHKFQHPGVHLSFPLKPLSKPPCSPSSAAEVGWLTPGPAAPFKGHRYKPKMRHDITVACSLGLDLHC